MVLRAALAFWAHPRVCGENLTVSENGEISGGSSPRVRGKHPLGAVLPAKAGLIPACAGKTPPTWHRQYLAWAHPRVCGENLV